MELKIQPTARYTVLGSGSWATAIAKLLTGNLANVGWYVREQEFVDRIAKDGRNPQFLTEVEFDADRLTLYADVNQAVRSSDVLIVVIPSAFIEVWMEGLAESLKDKFIVSAVKGILPESNKTVLEYMHDAFGAEFANMGIVTGPCHAEEVALKRLSYLTFACKDADNSRAVAQVFAGQFLRPVFSTDIHGTEYAAVLKNIYAVAAGICHGLGFGDNFQAVLVSNAHVEIKRFLQKVFPAQREPASSAYLGDLLVTCYSQFSRNRTFGNMIGKGYRVKDAQLEMSMVAEGYYATKCMHDLNASYKVELPIAEAMYRILYEGVSAQKEIAKLTEALS
ncbi:MAG: NAD(P)H-dependent glycerol-3-phosphate dehydrogenase [Prevotellaceae bacterium]|jgi:glycerol-3-phosphate dehydrogenase (NAD(P)+)|nr:NAD(P)H-dependent glycerol-3-phosphate dehydrogenase [Prevotellaceae bacterium]